MSLKNRILILENSHGATGAFKSIFGLTQSINHEFEFHFAIKKHTPLATVLKKESILYVELPYVEISRSWKTILYLPILFLNSWRVTRYLSKHQIHIIHVNDLYNMVGVLSKILRPSSKLIYHIRLLPDSYVANLYPYWLKLINRWADHVIAVSNSVHQSIRFKVAKPIEIIYDFVPLEERHGEQLLCEPDKVKFVYPANYMRGKGQDYALKAFSEVYQRHQNVALSFYGGDAGSVRNQEFKKLLIEECVALGLDKVVMFEEATDDIEAVMKKADVVLMFSESESFSMVCYEALFYGKPLIASDCGGPRELVENNVSGLLVTNRDTHAMANAMCTLVNYNELRHVLSINARKAIRDKMVDNPVSTKLGEVYKHFIA